MASMNEKDYYSVLGVEESATSDEIRKAFQQKARKLHPDVNKEPDAEERFKEISEAYAVLSDADKRRRYDAMRSGSPFGGVTGGYGSPAGTAGQGAYGDPFDWGFPFGGAYTGRRTTTRSRSYNPKAGADIIYEVTIDDEIARTGARRGVSYQRYAPCSACNGHGSVSHAEPITCPTCGGTGHMTIDLASLFGFGVMDVTCPECEGTGRVVEDPCESCGGSGRVLTASEVIIDIPAGVHDGETIRVAHQGNAGTNGKQTGDFVCEVQLPSERLTPQQATGLGIAGFALPFVGFGIVGQNGVGSMIMLIMGCLMAAYGIYLTANDGLRSNGHWLKKAFAAVAVGAARGVVLSFLLQLGGPMIFGIIQLMVIYMFVSLLMRRAR